MAVLKPDHTYVINGVKVNEKIIPDGTRWKNPAKAAKAGFLVGALYKKRKKLNNGSGRPLYLTIHNTDDLKNVEDDGEQYTRATFNENMKSVRIHFYVDDLGAWQNLRAGTGMSSNDPDECAEVSWHAADGSAPDGGNMTSLSMEVIMNDSEEHDKKAYDNAARLAAWLLHRHCLSIDRLVTHTYWVNKSAGKVFADVDEQCTNLIKNKKWCPKYIFKSTKHDIALRNWKEFKACVNEYLNEIYESQMRGPNEAKKEITKTLYLVQIGSFAKTDDAAALLRSLRADGISGYTVMSNGAYTVQIGAYSLKSNAEDVRTKIRALGYEADITMRTEAVSL